MRLSKRLFDLLVTTLGLIVILPLMAVISLLVWIFLGTPVLFRQPRPGFKGRPFITYKFRTMTNRLGPDGNLLPDAERLTPFGRFLRSTSLDDLPQVFNVLRGEMSLVGPRPPVPKEVAQYTVEQLHRLDAVPGITGLQQVSGRSDLNFKRWVELDLQYISEQSVWNDIKILLMTIPAVVTGRGSY